MQVMTSSRVSISPRGPETTVSCATCGQPALRTAQLRNDRDEPVADTVVCTNCEGAHRKEGVR